ncbi:MAG: CPBP family intramembrane metalloprotease [Asgard group archaeon]|nr:CPBP family intramembrane metalloprotease [Asgard group archaeon]
MTEEIVTTNVEKIIEDVPAKELLLFCIPISLIFAVSGMDFIGYFIYLATRSPSEIYERGVYNVLFLGFMVTTISLFVVSFVINKVRWKKPLAYFGTQKGNWKLGLIVVGVFILLVPLFYFNHDVEVLVNTYPMAKAATSKWYFFVLYELAYIIFYYIPYEFYFRGILQLGLSKTWKKWQSILFVTILTTALHATKPWTEIIASLVAGVIFGIIAEKTDSWLYVFIMHILAGVATDTFCALGYVGVL